MSIICNDAGHGGRDPGAIGKTTKEKDNNLIMALKVGKHLVRSGVSASYTRVNDKDFCTGGYNENTDLINRIGVAGSPDVFVAYHNDSFNKSAKGITTHCFKMGGSDERLARSIQEQLGGLPFVDRGIKASNFYVLRAYDGKNTSACLIEYGFIDSEEDNILENMDAASILITKGICEFLGVAYVPEVITTNSKNEDKGVEDVLKVAVILFSKEDYWAGADVADKEAAGVFIRRIDRSVPADAWNAKKLIVIGGPTTGHRGEVLLSGRDKYDTAAAVAKYLG